MPSFEFLGPYRIGEMLGRGGMGSVFSAVHEKTGEKVAVKLISQNVADDFEFRRRFNGEVATLQRLRHEGIVRLVGFGEERGQLFYSMELVDGEPLQARIRREKRIDWLPTIEIAIQICSALKHAHDIGVIHRDLKPANLLITSDGRVKLVDFGIAKIFGGGDQTVAGSVLGTADYMAPEQVRSEGITSRTDLYSLGSVMYAMLAGRPPFSGRNIPDVIASLTRDRPPPLDMIDPGLPEALVELIHELLEKDPSDRPPTALAVMNRLKAMRAGLQRDQTILASGLPTDSGVPPSSSNTDAISADGNDLSSAATGNSNQEGTGDNRDGTVLSNDARGPLAKGQATRIQAAKVSSQAATAALGTCETVAPDTNDSDAGTTQSNTHFQTADTEIPRQRSFGTEAAPTENRWLHFVSLAAMVAILLGCGLWFLNAARPPSADQAFAALSETGSVQAMDGFLMRFKDDPRYDEVFSLRVRTKVEQTQKRLKTQAKLGVTPLDSFEQGFLDALDGHQQDPKRASERLELWLDIHDSSTREMSDVEREMIELARHETKMLAERSPETTIDPRAQDLIERIRESVANAPVDESRKMLESILLANADQAWAIPAIEEAKKQLRSLDVTPAMDD